MDMIVLYQWMIPLATVAILYSAIWYFQLGTLQARGRRVSDLLIGCAVLAATIPMRLLFGPSTEPHGLPLAVMMASGLAMVIAQMTGRRRAGYFFMTLFVATIGINAMMSGATGQWWFGVIALVAVAGGLILRRWRAVDHY